MVVACPYVAPITTQVTRVCLDSDMYIDLRDNRNNIITIFHDIFTNYHDI